MDSRRPATAVIIRRPRAAFLVFPHISKPGNNPLLATPSRPALVPRRPSCLRFTVNPKKAKSDLSGCLTQRNKSYTLLTQTYGGTDLRLHTCADNASEDSSVMVDSEELEKILGREEAGTGTGRNSLRNKEEAISGKTITMPKTAVQSILRKKHSRILRTSNIKRRSKPVETSSGPLMLSPRVQIKRTRMAVITNASFESAETVFLDREKAKDPCPFPYSAEPFAPPKAWTKPNSEKVDIYLPFKLASF